jgi:hypothetical protein
MLRFFRQIRQRLLTDNKFSKYLLYAVGEIILVVIGILIALQINNWNEERKERQSEKQILLSLSQDFKANLSALDTSIIRIPQVIEKYGKVLEYSIQLDSGLTEEMKNTVLSTGFVLTNIVDGALTSLLDSDKLEIIRSDTLKRLLTAYPEQVRGFRDLEWDLKEYVVTVQRPIVRSYLNLADFILDDPKFDEFKRKSFKSDYEGLLRNKEYLNIVMGIRNINQTLLRRCQALQDRTNNINQIIETELSN